MDNFDVTGWNRKRYLDEIKINNPNDIFQVTGEGKKAFQDYSQLVKLTEKYITTDAIGYFDDAKKNDWFYLLNFSIIIDESLIDVDTVNKLENYLKSTENILGWNEKEAVEFLNNFKKQGWIK